MTTMTAPRRVVNRKPARPAHGVARLVLVINGTSYVVRRIPADPSIALKAYRLRKFDGTTYYVTRAPHGLQCDCPDWEFHRNGQDPEGCKHCKAMVAVGLMSSK